MLHDNEKTEEKGCCVPFCLNGRKPTTTKLHWTYKHSCYVLLVGRCLVLAHLKWNRNKMAVSWWQTFVTFGKQYTWICFWKDARQEKGNVVCWLMFDQHCFFTVWPEFGELPLSHPWERWLLSPSWSDVYAVMKQLRDFTLVMKSCSLYFTDSYSLHCTFNLLLNCKPSVTCSLYQALPALAVLFSSCLPLTLHR